MDEWRQNDEKVFAQAKVIWYEDKASTDRN